MNVMVYVGWVEERLMRGVVAIMVLLLVAGFVSSRDDVPPPSDEPVVVDQVEELPLPETSVQFDGDGDMSSDPFVLDPGDYVVEWTASDCSTGFSLKPLDDQWPYVRLATSGSANEGRDNVFDVEGGRWYLDVVTGPSPGCPWTLSLVPR